MNELIGWGTTRDSLQVIPVGVEETLRPGVKHRIAITLETCESDKGAVAVMAQRAFEAAQGSRDVVMEMRPEAIADEHRALMRKIESQKHFFDRVTNAPKDVT